LTNVFDECLLNRISYNNGSGCMQLRCIQFLLLFLSLSLSLSLSLPLFFPIPRFLFQDVHERKERIHVVRIKWEHVEMQTVIITQRANINMLH